MKTRPTKIYVAGPITNGGELCINSPEIDKNVTQAIEVCDKLLKGGYIPYCPHLTVFWHRQCPAPYQMWLDFDMEWLKVCDCLLRLPGPSSGADGEMNQMTKWNKPVFKSLGDLLRLMKPEVEIKNEG